MGIGYMALWGFRAKCWSGWVSGFEEKEGVMRNAMTTRAPGGANNKTCSINQFAKMFHTLFGLLNTNLKLLG